MSVMSTINVINHTIKKLEVKKNKISGFYICFASLKQDISLLRKIKIIVLIEESGFKVARKDRCVLHFVEIFSIN